MSISRRVLSTALAVPPQGALLHPPPAAQRVRRRAAPSWARREGYQNLQGPTHPPEVIGLERIRP